MILSENQIKFLNNSVTDMEKNWFIDDDGLISSHTGLSLGWMSDSKLNDGYLGLKFGRIEGNFMAFNLDLKTLEGSPHTVNGMFDISYNPIETTKGSPKIVTGEYWAHNTKIVSLEDIPLDITRLLIYNTPISSLIIKGIFEIMKEKRVNFHLGLALFIKEHKEEITKEEMELFQPHLDADNSLFKDIIDYGLII